MGNRVRLVAALIVGAVWLVVSAGTAHAQTNESVQADVSPLSIVTTRDTHLEPSPEPDQSGPVNAAVTEADDATSTVLDDAAKESDRPRFASAESAERPAADPIQPDLSSDSLRVSIANSAIFQDPAQDPVQEQIADTAAAAPVRTRNPTSDLLMPLLVFVAIASVAMLATIPFFLRQRKRSDTVLRELALTDDLTNLANRRRLDRDLLTHQQAKHRIAVAMIDIDHFKRLNDDFGHTTGDVVLQHIAAAISANVRVGDVAYRYGGEEFCVLLPDATELEAAVVVDRVRKLIENTAFSFLDRKVTISVGVAVAPNDGADSTGKGTVQRADAALYSAKNSGRNRVMLSSLLEAGRGI